MTRQLIKLAVAIMTTLLALIVLWQFRIIIIYVLVSLMLAASLRPLVNRLAKRSFVVRMAWILAYLMALVCIGFLLFLTGEAAFNEIQSLVRTVSVQDEWKLPVWLEGSSFQLALVAQLPPLSLLVEAITGSQGQLVIPAILNITQGIGGFTSGIFIILFLSIYWIISQIHFERLWLSLLPSDQRKQARGIWRMIEPEIGAYLRNQVIQSLVAGLMLGFGYWLIGSPYPAFLALVGALACFIPVVGAALVVIFPLLLGLLTSVQLSMFTILYALVVLTVMKIWFTPRLVNSKWDNPILNVVFLIALTDAFGIIGIIISPPLAIVCQILWSHLVSHRPAAGAAAQVFDLKERLINVRDTIEVMDESNLPLITSSMERLERLFVEATPILAPVQTVEPSK